MRYIISIFLSLSLIIVANGCTKTNPNRHDVAGTVTWKGKPIPGGVISFMPDISKGARGPQGFTTIKDGKFDTRDSLGRGSPLGSVVISVTPTDGKPAGENGFGTPLFSTGYTQKIEISKETTNIEIVIPDNTPLFKGNIDPT